jgi:uncharacterized protein (TIGR01244 family)
MRGAASLLFAFTIGLGAQSTPPGIRNYTRLDATVACAGATSIEAIPATKADGIKAIVNLRLASEADVDLARRTATSAGLRYNHIPFSGTDPQTEAVDQFLAAMKDPANSPVFIHCGSGNRAGMMWLVKRVMVDGWPLDKATLEAERAGLRSTELKAFALQYLKAHGKA